MRREPAAGGALERVGGVRSEWAARGSTHTAGQLEPAGRSDRAGRVAWAAEPGSQVARAGWSTPGRWSVRALAAAALLVLATACPHRPLPAADAPASRPLRPNVVFILCDNLGYGDLGCYGSTKHRTPHVDRLAAEGTRFTDFYSTSGVCTPSRASLLTGCYPRRVGLDWTVPDGHVLRPVSPNGLNPNEVTVAELLKAVGYRTACIGKWHLGDQPPFLPTRQGFDYYLGIPYSDDMTPRPGTNWPPLPLMENERVIEAPVDRNLLTKRYTQKAIEFLEANRNRPFFLYLAHAMPGSTKRPFASERFRGKSRNGPYGDSVEELDWSTGEILSALQRLGLEDKTLVVWTSDNGAPRRNPPQGSNAPLSGWGYTTMEGGMRVPLLVRWPGHVPAGRVCHELTTMMDWLPTLAGLAGASVPSDRIIDGHDIWPLLAGVESAHTPYDAFYYWHTNRLYAVRSGPWKLHLAIPGKVRNTRDGRPMDRLLLYNLRDDVAERHNLADQRPDVVRRLLKLAERARRDLGEGPTPGPNCRPCGRVKRPRPQVLPNQPEPASRSAPPAGSVRVSGS